MLKKYLKELSKRTATLSFSSGSGSVKHVLPTNTETKVVSPFNGVVVMYVNGSSTSTWFRIHAGAGEFLFNNISNYRAVTLPVKKGNTVTCHPGTSPSAEITFFPCEADR